jgi:drug/metabolite transporter (DMT)-like permease
MTQRIIGIALIVLGIVTLAWGGVFWTDRETVLDAGPLEITAQEREGVRLPPVLGVLALVGGIVLLVAPDRQRSRASR